MTRGNAVLVFTCGATLGQFLNGGKLLGVFISILEWNCTEWNLRGEWLNDSYLYLREHSEAAAILSFVPPAFNHLGWFLLRYEKSTLMNTRKRKSNLRKFSPSRSLPLFMFYHLCRASYMWCAIATYLLKRKFPSNRLTFSRILIFQWRVDSSVNTKQTLI